MDKFDLMEVNEKQRERIDELLKDSAQMLGVIRHKEKIIKTQQEYIRDLEIQSQTRHPSTGGCMTDHEKTSRDYLEAWRTSQAEMQRLRDLLEAEREKVRVLREALEEITEANEQTPVKTYQRMEDIARAALATTEPEDV